MKKLLLIFCLYCSAAFGQGLDPNPPGMFKLRDGLTSRDYLPSTLIVKFRAGFNAAVLRETMSGSLQARGVRLLNLNQVFRNTLLSSNQPLAREAADTIGVERIYELKYSGNSSIETLINDLLRNPLIEYAEPSYIHRYSYVPNDQFYASSQNYLRQIRADQAWDVIRSSSGVVIAIVDSGSDMEHPDLQNNFLLPGKDLVGSSFSNLTEDDDPDVKSDSTDHGVRVSGLASAVSDNGIGISSVAFNAKLLIVKAGADNNARAIYRGYEGIKYAADRGANIINCSWGSTAGGAYGQDIINYAIAKGSLVIAAAGNEASPVPEYPAAYQGVMAVASVDNNDRKNSFSNYGPYVSIVAPGEVLTTINRGGYGIGRGTSFATPIVSSAAALVKARFPAFDMSQVKEQLRITADNIEALNPVYAGLIGRGRLNVMRAVSETPPSVRQQKITTIDKGRGSNPPGDTIRFFFDLKNFLSPVSGLTVSLSSDNPNVQVIDRQVTVASLGTLQVQQNVGAFRVYIRPSISDNEPVNFVIAYSTAAGYSDNEQFTINAALDYMNITVNKVSTTISSNGRVGFSAPQGKNGLGFLYENNQLLFEASLLIGNSASRVSNNARNDFGGSDEHFKKKIRVGRVDDPAAFKAVSEFDDSENPNALGIRVKHTQTAYATAPDDKYTLVEYEIQNTGNTTLNNLYAGVLADWDVDGASRDVTRYDSGRKLGYVYPKAGSGTHAGIRLLNRDVPAAYYPISPQIVGDPAQNGGGLSLAEKYQILSSGIKAVSLGESSPNGLDVLFATGYGPYSIPANGVVKIAFAFIAGDSLSDLQASAEAAQAKYDLANPVTPGLPADGFVLNQNIPNPVSGETLINFFVSGSGLTTLKLYNSRGQTVRELVNSNLVRGAYSINLNAAGLEPGVYFYKMSYKGKEKTLKLLVSR